MRLSSLACFGIALLFCSGVSTCTRAGDVQTLAASIDRHIDARLADEKIEAAESVSDAEFVRRVTLDLAGRIPTLAELDAYLAASDPDRKRQLVERLMASADFAFQQRDQLDSWLLLREEYSDPWREYLLEATRENRPWDQLFREIMLPEETLSSDSRPVAFLKRRTDDLDAMTNDSSITWFGVNIACAKCHDHPLVDDWTQAHYYGMAAFFKRTFKTKKGFLSERFDGLPKYTDVDGEEHQAEFMFLTGAQTAAPAVDIDADELKQLQEKIKKSEQDDKADDPPRPDFRPRAKLVEMALAEDTQPFFARNIVNRLWARFFGRGLVHPLDQMHSQNPASHPQLLDELTADMQASGYDLQRLIRAIVLSQTYARSMRHVGATQEPAPELFATAVPRPLTPRQLSLSLRVAGANPQQLKGLEAGEDWSEKRAQLERQADGIARQLTLPDADFQVPLTEALWFSNNAWIENDFLNASPDRLIGLLKTIESDEEAVLAAMRAVLSRSPSAEESQALLEYLESRGERREQGLKQIVWALVSSPEFRFNH